MFTLHALSRLKERELLNSIEVDLEYLQVLCEKDKSLAVIIGKIEICGTWNKIVAIIREHCVTTIETRRATQTFEKSSFQVDDVLNLI